MSMFCYQCQEAAKGTGCEVRGVCGKTEEVAKLQDLLIYTLKGISEVIIKNKIDISILGDTNYQMLSSLFMTITNANFDENAIKNKIEKMISIRDELRKSLSTNEAHDSVTFIVDSKESMISKAASVGVLSTANEDVRSLREMIVYGLKGIAAYADHAKNIGKENLGISAFIYEALAATL